MEKNNADKYLQSQRSSLVTIHNNLGGRSPSSSNGFTNDGVRSALTPIAEQDFTFDEVKESLPIVNGYGVDPLASIVPRALPLVDPLKSPDNESVVSDSQVYLVYYCIFLYTICIFFFNILMELCISLRILFYI